jgi:hypothetical protein
MKRLLSLLPPLRQIKILFALMGLFLSLTAWSQLPTAPNVASQIKVGWNIGNTLEATGGETAWGNPKVTQQLINAVKAAGFNAVRIPCAWDGHANQSTSVIDAAWIARVKEVVDYCINNNMYVVLNIHWDGGWLEEHPLYSYQTAVNAKQRTYWTQIANYFKNYNEHLLFAGTNEVHADYNTPTTENITVQQSFNQTFVDAVRATGGNNATRTLVVQTYNTNAWHGLNYFSLPTDPASNRLIVEIHNYDPYDFTLNQSGGCLYWGSPYPTQSACSWAQESYFDDLFSKVKSKWVDSGVPVIIGEYAVSMRSSLTGQQRTDHIASREYYIKYVTKAAQQRGIKSFYWDIGTLTNGSALFDRNSGAIIDQGTLTAIMQGASVTTTQYITIKNRTSGLLIDGVGRTTNGSNASQWSSSTSYNQQWLVETAGSYVKIKNRATGLYLDGMGRTTNGSIAGQWSSSTSNNQQWTIETTGSYSKLKNRATGLYIDGMGSTTSGADLAQWSSSSSNNQQWTLTNVTARTATTDVGVEQHKSTERDVNLFPNPFTSGINVSIRDPKEVKSIMVVDLAGKQVEVIQHEDIGTEQTVGSLLNPGMYVVHINGLRSSQSFKVIKK